MDDDVKPQKPQKPQKPEKLEDVNLDDEEAGEDPNEYLDAHPTMLDSSVWLVKVPKGLMERWSAVKDDAIPLATLRIYKGATENDSSRITINLPENPQYDVGDEPKDWEFTTDPGMAHSQYIVSDKPKVGAPSKRARITSVKGKVSTRGKMMRSKLTAEYGAKMRQRVEAGKPKRHVKLLTDASIGQAGSNLRMIQSGAMQTNAGFNTAVGRPATNGGASASTNRAVEKQPFERATRISRDELLDQLFTLFTPEQPFLSLKELRRRTNQPEAYLKEILTDIAEFHRHGPNTNMFSLKSGFGTVGAASSTPSGPGPEATAAAGASSAPAKMEEDDEDDDDDDMEEIS